MCSLRDGCETEQVLVPHECERRRMRCSSSTPALTPAVARSSNLQHYRALLQVMTFAAQREQTAEQVIRDAMMGGVAVPFTVTQNSKAPTTTMKTGDPSCTNSSDTPVSVDHLARGDVGIITLLMPSSKFIGTLALLLADGFFSFAPLSSTVEKSRGTSYQHRSECQVRDLFTLIMLLFPECFIAETPQRTALEMRETERSVSETHSSNHAESDAPHQSSVLRVSRPISPTPLILSLGQCTSSVQRIHTNVTERRSMTADSESLSNSVIDTALGGVRPATCEGSSGVLTLAKLATTDTGVTDGEGLGVSSTSGSIAANMIPLPIVNTVPLSLDVLDVLLESRRSLAIVLLSVINDALREVQYRQLEQSHTGTSAKGATTPLKLPLCEGGVLQFSAEVLLTAKLLLISSIMTSAIWRQRFSKAMESAQSILQGTVLPPSPPSSPFHVLSELLGEDAEGSTPFLTLPVERWSWGRDKDALGQWYDRLLDRLLIVSDSAGLPLDAYLKSAKSTAVSCGRSVSAFPALLLHRPSDGQPAVEMSLSSVPRWSGSVRLPSLPIQQGEPHVLLCPSVLNDKTGVLQARGNELLLDATASPTADFFHACVSSACTEAQLQPSGDAVPWLFRHRLTDLSSTEQGIITAALCDPTTLSAVLEKNAAMLARITLWCRNRWPPSSDASTMLKGAASESNSIVEENGGSKGVHSIGDQVEQHILFHRPFSASVGRYVRELVTLKGLSKDVLEAWMRHVCTGADSTGGAAVDSSISSPHRAMFEALVKFAVLHNRWQLNPEVEALQKEYAM
ncbi:hypothetical protein, conserved [Leishmania tarentolae]|uniref:Uncharacterized protein n=1 Tax=Leishmania tarentolae TaxID=5689 RepID=A0A640KTV0_LEITA|nr:hypothetical protein, conserved [Leishmania tarentolae]